MSHVLHLVEGARVEQHEAKQAAHPLVQPTRAEYGPVAEFMLPGIQKVEEHAVDRE